MRRCSIARNRFRRAWKTLRPTRCILDLSGLESLFGSLPKIARDIARRTSDLGLEANVATAFNPDTARFAARGFSGVTVIAEGKEAERMGNLPLDVLFPELTSPEPSEEAARLLETFDLWGVRNFRALCALPEVALSERLGRRGVGLQQLARGVISRTLVPVDPPLIFEEAMELDHPLVLLEPLAFLLAHMLDQLCARLAARALAAQELRLQLHLDNGFHFVEDVPVDEVSTSQSSQLVTPDASLMHCHTEQSENSTLKACHPERSEGPAFPWRMAPAPTRNLKPETRNSTFTRTIELPVPMLDAKVFLKLLQLDLKAHPPGAPILKVHLSATPAQPRTTQGGLFLPPTPEPEKLELTLARIAGMVGEDKVGSLQLLDSHRPEAFRMQRFVPMEPAGEKRRSRERHSRAPRHCAAQSSVRLCAPRSRCATASPPTSSATSGKKFTGTSSGWPAPGALPATGGSRMAGRATNGTSQQQSSVASRQSSANPPATNIPWHFTAWCTTCSADIGSWRGRMTRAGLSSQVSVSGLRSQVSGLRSQRGAKSLTDWSQSRILCRRIDFPEN